MKNNKVDVLIVGAGPAGAAAAWNLSKTNLNIACFEQGPNLSKKEFDEKSENYESLKLSKFNVNPNIRKLISDYPINDKKSQISVSNFNAVGGSTVLYSAHVPRFHSSDFKANSLDGVGSDWPLNYKDLKKYYELNEKMMSVAGLIGDPAYPEIKKLSPPVKLDFAGEVMAKAFNKLKWHWWPSYSGINTSKIKKRNKDSITTANNSYWPMALKNGVKLFPNHRVAKIKLDKLGKATGVIYFDEKNIERFQEASIVILACSGIGTPRLLLNSSNKSYPNGLANSSGLVGKNLMLHPLGFVEGKFKNFLSSNRGPSGCCIYSHQFYKTSLKNNFKRGYTIQVLRGAAPLETAISLNKFKELNFGKKFHDNFFENYGHKISLAIICEDLPEKQNYISLDRNSRDSNGIPGVKINYKLSENSKHMLSDGLKKGKMLMKKAQAINIKAFGPVKHTGWHIMGTAKMGLDKKTSVVNEFGQSHDVKNLVILDSSIFTTSSAVNPVATITALALKISDNIKNKSHLFK